MSSSTAAVLALSEVAKDIQPGQQASIAESGFKSTDINQFCIETGATPIHSAAGVTGIRLPNGGTIAFEQPVTVSLASNASAAPSQAGSKAGIDAVLSQGGGDDVAEVVPLQGSNDGNDEVPESAGLLPGLPGSGLTFDGAPLGGSTAPLAGERDETRTWGRDDLKRGEFGSQGQNLHTALGSGLDHLVGLNDEAPGHRNGEMLIVNDNQSFAGETVGVGSGIDHLWLLGDTDYLRASRDLEEGESLFEDRRPNSPSFEQLTPELMALAGIEDTALSIQLYDPAKAVLPIKDLTFVIDPSTGSIVVNPDGTLDFTPAPGYSGVTSFTYTYTDPRNGETVTGEVKLTVEAVVDTPDITGAATTFEDTAIPAPVTIKLNDPDGSEIISKVVISGLPAGAVLSWNTSLPGHIAAGANGKFTVTGSTEEIQALLKTLVVEPPVDFHGEIVLDVAVTVVEENVDPKLPGYRDKETFHHTLNIHVEAVADPVTAAGDVETTDEDVSVHLDDLAATFGDLIDGSEVHTVEIRGVDPDAWLLDGPSGSEYPFTIAPDGTKTYTLDPAQVGSVWFLPPVDESGEFAGMTIVAIATETSNGDQQTASAPILVTVAPVADPLDITAPTQATNEDTPVTFGDDITIVVNDPLTQTVTEVIVAGFPAGTRIQYLDENNVAQDIIAPSGGGSVTFGGPGITEAQIRAALATLTLTPPADSDVDIALTITATTEDLGSVTDTQTVPMIITVAAVADLPPVDFSAGPNVQGTPGSLFVQGVEDINLPVPVTLDLADLDGSESMDPVVITGLPAGYSFQGLTPEPDGSYIISGTKADIQTVLAALVIVPPANADDDFTLTVTVTSRETDPTTTGGDAGDVAVLTATNVLTIPVVFIAAHDAPVITGSSSVPEDNTVNFGNNIVITRDDDTDGSETITEVVIADVPTGAVISYPGDGTLPAVPGINIAVGIDGLGNPTFTITRTTGSQADLLDALHAFTLTAPDDSDRDITLSVDVTTTDNDGVTGTTNGSHDIIIRAIADPATLAIPSPVSGNEDQPIAVAFSVARADTDPSQATPSEAIETVVIRDIPAGFTLSSTSTAATLSLNLDGSYTVTGPDLSDPVANDAAINLVLANLTLTPGSLRDHFDDDFTLRIDVTTIENNLDGGQVDVLRNTQTFNVPVAVAPIADPVTNSGASSVVEDNAVTFGADIVLAKVDDNSTLGSGPSSETITAITVSGIPAGSVLATGAAVANVSVDISVAGQVTLTLLPGGSEADIQAALDQLTLTPPADSDVDITLGLAVTTVDRFGTAEASAPVTTTGLSHAIVVTADAAGDEPTISGASSGVEDTTFALPITITLGDIDGSEILDRVEVSGLPGGAAISWLPANLPAGVTATATATGWVFDQTVASYATTQALQTFLSTHLLVTPRQDSAADFQLSVTAYNYEQNLNGAGGRTAALPSTTATIDVTVTPAFDTVTLPTTSSLVNEDEDRAPATSDGSVVSNHPGSVVFGAAIESALTRTGDTGVFDAADRSEGISQIVLTNLPTGAVNWTDQVGVTVSESPAGTFTLAVDALNAPADPAALEAVIRQVLASFSYAASDHGSADIPVGVAVTRQDLDPDTGIAITGVALNATHNIVVNAIADAPTVAGDTEFTREDVRVHLDDLTAALRDTDGSETLSVQIQGVPTGASLTNAAGTAYASPSAGVYTIPVAALGDVYFVPPAQASGVFNMTIVATATEATVAGENLADDVASVQAPIVVTVTPVVDPVVANASGSFVNENTTFNLGANIIESAEDGDTLADFTLADLDGSQSLAITIAGFPAGIAAFINPGYTLPGGVTANFAAGTFTLSGANAADVMAALAQVRSIVTEDGDANFQLTVTAVTDENNPGGLPEGAPGDFDAATTVILHDVRVLAVADTPDINRGTATKLVVEEDSGFVTYPVTVALNDTDGSETYQSVVLAYSTQGSAAGALPVLQFTVGASTVDTGTNGSFAIGGATMVVSNGQVSFSGDTADIETALASLEVRPGANNGEDITITVTVTAVESNPTEDNNGAAAGIGGGIVGPEIAVPTAVAAQSFVIPVDPVPETPSLGAPVSATGTEDTRFAIAGISVTSGSPDPDGSETRFLEVDTASYPSGTSFYNGTTLLSPVNVGGWIRIPESALANLNIRGPNNYSGTVNLVIRGVIVDTSASDTVTTTTIPQALPVTVQPVADAITPPSASVGVEDNGAVAFGATLANTSTGIRLVDRGTGSGNNAETETISQVVLDFPADTASQTYSVTQGALVGSAQIAFNAGTRAYTITSTIITGAADVGALSQADRAQAEADIRATLAGFTVEMGPAHTDVNGVIQVTATTLDVNGGIASTQANAFSHSIVIQAVADAPTVSVTDPLTAVTEDGANQPIIATVGQSADDDGSETLSVRITVPSDGLGPVGTLTGSLAGITMVHQGGGVYVITASGADNAARAALFNEFMNGGAGDLAFDPRNNWSGELTGANGLLVESISTEAATLYGDTLPAIDDELAPNNSAGSGTLGDLDTKVEIRSDHIDIRVTPVADAPSVKGNATGLEDTPIPVPMSVTLADRDGSETYQVIITAVLPATTQIFGASGEILPNGLGQYILSPADVAALTIVPPLHYSSIHDGDILLSGFSRVTDTSNAGSVTADFPFADIHVEVTGVADAPTTRTLLVTGVEDQPIDLGAAILNGGPVNGVLVDADGSETLSLVLSGMPAGAIPTSSVPGGINYLGNGTWQISAAAVSTLLLPTVPNYSGENPYSGLTIRAVTQEIDGDQATSALWPVTFAITPVINAATVDGFSSWNTGVTLPEAFNETPGSSISLLSATNHVLVDNDGSESVVSYTFDLSNLIGDAEIGQRLLDLEGPGAGLDEIIASYISGTFSYDSGLGTITILAADLPSVTLDSTLFMDSNVDFSLPVSALVRDTAIIGGSPVSVDKIETGTFPVDLVGTADIPTAFASSVIGSSGTLIPVALGGVSTDTDITLGRTPSEEIYYIVELLNPADAPKFGFSDGAGNTVGLDNGDGTWLLTPSQLADLHMRSPLGATGIAELRLYSIATENDGDVASNTADFTYEVTYIPGSTPVPPPLPPSVIVNLSSGNEDGSITINVVALPGTDGSGNPDPTNPTVAVMFSGLPPGAVIVGATFNPVTGRAVANATDVNAGNVFIIPPPDFSGTMTVTVEAVATNASMLQASSGNTPLPVEVIAVADGVNIVASPDAGLEDALIALNIGLSPSDATGALSGENSGEILGGQAVTLAGSIPIIGSFAYVQLSDGATLPGYTPVAPGDSDATIDGQSMLGFYRVLLSDVPSLQLLPAADWHGTVTVDVAAYSMEPTNGDIALSQQSFGVNVAAVADAPMVTVADASGDEDTTISLTGLSAALEDLVSDNGAELLSTKISGVPDGSLFSAGSNNGDGSWTIPLAALATLAITPPEHYAGEMTLTLTAIALELSNGSEAQTSVDFTVTVAPLADAVLMLAENVALDASGIVPLDLSIRMSDDRGTSPGEIEPEILTLNLTSVPTGVFLVAGLGGSIEDLGGGAWTFIGNEAQANALQMASGPGTAAGNHVIGLSAVTTDGGSTLAVPTTDSFVLSVSAPSNAGQQFTGDGTANNLSGGAGNDILLGLGGNDTLVGGGGIDRIHGGLGSDTMTGGSGADQFIWAPGDDVGGLDQITDFAAGLGGDQLDLAALLLGFDPQSSVLSEFVRLSSSAGNTTVSIDANGSAGGESFTNLVVLQGITGLDLDDMRTNGNLLV